MNRIRTAWVSLSALLLLCSSVFAQADRHALIIGNGNYEVGKLKNPVNDAKLMQSTLESLGFKVTTHADLTQEKMDGALEDFSRSLPKGSVAFFYFAGHGVQTRNSNYLIPIDAKLRSESSVKYQTVALDYVTDLLEESRSNLNVIVLDCCRDNPFERSWGRSSGPRGMAGLEVAPEGTIVAYSTAKGKTAADGVGNNSPYTKCLASALSERTNAGLVLREVFYTASRAVHKATNQKPHLYLDATLPEYYLISPSSASKPLVASKAEKAEELPMPPNVARPKMASKAPASTKPERHPLIQQATAFLNDGKYELAIEAYSAVVSNSTLSPDVRAKARRGRGATYLARRSTDDIQRAIIDYQAAGEKGVRLSVLRGDARLKVGSNASGKVHRNEVVMLTKSSGNWLWVASVQGNDGRKGWIDQNVFKETVVSVASPPVAKSSNPVSQPSSPSVATSDASAQPINPIDTSASSSPQGTSTSNVGTPVVSASNIQNMQPNSGPSVQPQNSPTQSGQVIGFDSNGQPIFASQAQQPNSPTTRSVMGQNGTYYIDQYGRRIQVTGSPPTSNPQMSNVQPNQRTVYVDQNGRPINNPSGSADQSECGAGPNEVLCRSVRAPYFDHATHARLARLNSPITCNHSQCTDSGPGSAIFRTVVPQQRFFPQRLKCGSTRV